MSGFSINYGTPQGPLVAAALRNIARKLGGDRTPLHAQMATLAAEMTRQYVRGLGTSARAAAMGAVSSNHWGRMADSITSSANADGGMVEVPRVSGLMRAFRTYVVTPQNGSRYLTIPVHPEGYAKRAPELKDLVFLRVGPRQTPVLARRASGGSGMLVVLYVLVRRAVMTQKRELLPSDHQFYKSAEAAADQFLKTIFAAEGFQPPAS